MFQQLGVLSTLIKTKLVTYLYILSFGPVCVYLWQFTTLYYMFIYMYISIIFSGNFIHLYSIHIFYHVFCMLVKEIADNYNRDLKSQAKAIEALWKAAEAYLVVLFKDTNLCTIHAK